MPPGHGDLSNAAAPAASRIAEALIPSGSSPPSRFQGGGHPSDFTIHGGSRSTRNPPPRGSASLSRRARFACPVQLPCADDGEPESQPLSRPIPLPTGADALPVHHPWWTIPESNRPCALRLPGLDGPSSGERRTRIPAPFRTALVSSEAWCLTSSPSMSTPGGTRTRTSHALNVVTPAIGLQGQAARPGLGCMLRTLSAPYPWFRRLSRPSAVPGTPRAADGI